MALSSIDKELIKYFAQLNEPQKQPLLQMIKTFLNLALSEWSRYHERYNKESDEAMERISKGEFTTMEELEKGMNSQQKN
ncbi:MAG: hypothetical protein ABI863_22755 [Ginsengibacter sp.]